MNVFIMEHHNGGTKEADQALLECSIQRTLHNKIFYLSAVGTKAQGTQLICPRILREFVVSLGPNSGWLGALSTTPWYQLYTAAIDSCLHFLGQDIKENRKDKFSH